MILHACWEHCRRETLGLEVGLDCQIDLVRSIIRCPDGATACGSARPRLKYELLVVGKGIIDDAIACWHRWWCERWTREGGKERHINLVRSIIRCPCGSARPSLKYEPGVVGKATRGRVDHVMKRG